VKQTAQRISMPEPLRLVEPAAVVETAIESSVEAPTDTAVTVEAQEAVEAAPAPATVPVVSVAVDTPAVASPTPATAPAAAPPARRDFAAEARAGAARVQQSAEATLARLRQNTGQIWSEATAQVSAQSKAQATRLRGLRKRITAGLASLRNDQATLDALPDDSAGE
jgi:hypothetical protein